MTRSLLSVTAALELATGGLLLASPSLPVSLLLGTGLDTLAGVVLARVAGSALLSLGLACWLLRHDGPGRAGRGLVTALLVYNVAVAAVLAHARLGLGLGGVALWPAVLVHAVLAAWCGAARRPASPAG